jgi:hypothetical protein
MKHGRNPRRQVHLPKLLPLYPQILLQTQKYTPD